jgi:hypothetical protein
MQDQPVLSQAGIVAAVSAVLLALVSLGILNLTDAQMQAIVAAVGAMLVVVAPIVGGLWARNRTTPLAKPVDDDGMPLVRADDREPPAQAMAAGRTVIIDIGVDGPAGATTAQPRGGKARPAYRWSR